MSRVSQAQMKKLLDLLCEDGILINGKVAYTNTNKQNFWKRVALQLNAVEGGVYKNTWKWCKMWADWKNKTKKKANIILRRKNYSLEHPSPTLSALERRLLTLINYPLDDKTDAIRLEMVAKMEPTEKPDNFNLEFLNEDYNECSKEKSSSEDDDKGSSCYDKNESKFCDVNAIAQEDTFAGLGESSDLDHKVKLKRKSFKKKKLSLEEYKIKTTLNLEKDRVQQKNEELRLRALELKLKGEELRLKEIEMNKINYLTNIEEEKLKCFRDISSSLKESERESYGDTAIGYVQVKREKDICVVKARITPEHNVHQKCYNVTATCNESEGHILSVQCEDCAAHLGGCKHAIAFLAWLHRRSEDPPSTSVECYWKKAKLSTVGTSLKFIKAKEITSSQKRNIEPKRPQSASFLSALKNHSHSVNDMDNQLMKYFKEPTPLEKLSIHYLRSRMQSKPSNAQEFIEFCGKNMDMNSCEKASLATINQSDCPLWYELRYARITASKAHEAAQCKTIQGALTESILGAIKLKDTEAMKRGRLLENQVLKRVEQMKEMKIKKCGLKLHSKYPIMGASPDGVSENYVIEVKCPSTDRSMSQYIKDNQVTLKYKAQVQLQMHFYNKSQALFCVAASDFETTSNVNIIEVKYEKEFCEEILNKCTLFWSNAIFPFLYK